MFFDEREKECGKTVYEVLTRIKLHNLEFCAYETILTMERKNKLSQMNKIIENMLSWIARILSGGRDWMQGTWAY